jgi:FKBP-type peptidyl-prolyl cis-trans isomerase SlyD
VNATITEIGDSLVTLDTNHPLAGQTLVFDVKIAGLRAGSKAEIEHGHVHFEHDHH